MEEMREYFFKDFASLATVGGEIESRCFCTFFILKWGHLLFKPFDWE